MIPSWIRIRAVMQRHWVVLRRSPHRWFEISFWPFMDVLLWGSLGAYIAKQTPSSNASTTYLLAGLTMFWVFTQAQFSIALGVNEETWTRNILNVFTTPIREIEYIAGIALFGLIKLVACLVTLTVATAVLFDFDVGQVGWGLLPISLLLIINGWALGLVAVGLVLRFGQSAEILIWGLNYTLLAVSGVFFPIQSLPGPFHFVAYVLPTSRLFAAVRSVIDGGSLPWTSLAISTGASLVFLGLATLFALRLLRVFRHRGYVTRYS